jgi:hypothetical protein
VDGDQAAMGPAERWLRTSATVLAPVTVLGGLLFYFGYVSARSQYEYFGVDVDTIGLGTQDYVMRSPQPLLVPLLVLALLGVGSLALHSVIREHLATADARRASLYQLPARILSIIGLVVLGAGVILLFAYTALRGWSLYPLVTPLVIAFGAATAGYASHVLRLLGPFSRSGVLRRLSGGFLAAVIAVSVFWATATLAQWSGRGLAQDSARKLDLLPIVILDTKERLFLGGLGIAESTLPASEGQTFHYRYRNLRLLIHGRDRMFLVPDNWSAGNTTLVVPLNDSVRVQFQFQNQPPN